MIQSPLTTQQARQNYPLAAGYSNELTRRYAVWQLIAWLTKFYVFIVVVVGVWRIKDKLLQDPLTILGILLDPLALVLLAILIGACGVFFLVILGFLWLIHIDKNRTAQASAKALDQQGVVTQGIIIDRWDEMVGDGEAHTTYTFIAYQYAGCVMKQQMQSNTARHTRTIGTHVLVRYLPSNALVARLEGAH